MMKFLCLAVLLVFVLFQKTQSYRSKGERVAEYARQQIGSTKYPYTDSIWDYIMGNAYKGHIFVADVLQHVGVRVPIRAFPHKPIALSDWKNKNSPFLAIASMCWRTCWRKPTNGDVIAYDGIVGIASGNNMIIFSDSKANPPGLVVQKQSQYKKGKNGICWHYMC